MRGVKSEVGRVPESLSPLCTYSNMSTTIYVLRLEGGKYYVGKTDNVQRRYQEHLNGKGSAWTREHSPVKLERTIKGASVFDEDKIVKELMAKHGIDNVRGGAYVNKKLDAVQTEALTRELRGATDCCNKCGKSGHFAARCHTATYKKEIEYVYGCMTCGKEFSDEAASVKHEKTCKGKTVKQEVVYVCIMCDKEYSSEAACVKHQNTCKRKIVEDEEEVVYACYLCEKEYSSEAACERHQMKCSGTSASAGAGSCYRCGRAGHYSPDCYASRHVKGYELD